MNLRLPPRSRTRCQRGAALVTVLAIVTILAALLLSYLITTQLEKQSTTNYSETIRAEELALGALQQIVTGLQQEMIAGSSTATSYTVNDIRIFQPLTNTTQIPARLGFALADYGVDVDSTGMKLPPTLLQVSRSGATYSSDYDTTKTPAQLASAISSSNVSKNRRSITAARWNKPQLMGNQVPLPFSSRLPDWVYVTRAGARVCTTAEASAGTLKADPAGNNANAVLGRYAYVIYDQGALLDINVAGQPQSAASAEPARAANKSYATYAALTAIPGLSQALVDEFTTWRNQGGSTLYPTRSTLTSQAAAKGFLHAWSGDNPLLSRQDMIDYLKSKSATNSIPYLSTFSRAANAPSWSPQSDHGGSYNYKTDANTTGRANRNLANLRAPSDITVNHYDDQGVLATYAVKTGEPLFQRRFSLAKLAWITRTGNAAGISDAAIRTCFGLEWDNVNKRWTYVDTANAMPSPNAIKTLDVVASEGREPNFFELLKGCMLSGSLGRDPGTKDTASPDASLANNGVMGFGFETASSVSDAQIFRIGASIIDQADEDSFPTVIYCRIFNGLNPVDVVNTFVGVENLPYLHRLHQIVMATTPGSYSATPQVQGRLGGWLQPEIWNPHQVSVSSAPLRPTRFRIRTYGMAMTTWFQWIDPAPNPVVMNGAYATGTPLDYEGADAAKGTIYFTDAGGSASPYYNNPVALTTGLVDTANTDQDCLFDVPLNEYPHITGADRSNAFAAIYSGEASVPYVPKTETNSGYMVFARSRPVNEFSVALEFQDESGRWHPYSTMLRLQGITSASINANNPDELKILGSTAAKLFYNHADARTDRFSISGDWPNTANNNFTINKTIWDSATGSHSVAWFAPKAASFGYAGGTQFSLGDWQLNTTSARARYASPDGITRPADGFRGNDSTGDGRQTYHGGTSNPRRPVVLDRPFRSVGELGYVFRDEPFKTLDFWSEQSADAALLDAFSLTEEPRTIAGQVQVNNSPQTVLQAILQGSGKNANNTAASSLIDSALATNLASGIATELRARPIVNRADLATKLATVIQTALATPENTGNKTYAETPLRALAAVTDTRTWTLLIDVIAQSGRMAPNATGLDQFLVEGEKRYWLHVALDRFTGEIIDQQLEPVYE